MTLSIALKSLFSYSHSNEWLIEKFAQTQDHKLFAQLYDNCADDLYHFLLSLSDQATAQDIAQKTWLKVIEKPHLYQATGRFSSWLFTLARNSLIDEFRRNEKWRNSQHSDHAIADRQVEPYQTIQQAFGRALENLPFEQREAFCLQQEGFGLQEIADMTHVGLETVKSRIRYAKQSLRNQLEKHHE